MQILYDVFWVRVAPLDWTPRWTKCCSFPLSKCIQQHVGLLLAERCQHTEGGYLSSQLDISNDELPSTSQNEFSKIHEEGTGVSLAWRNTERARAVQPGEEKAQERSYQILIPDIGNTDTCCSDGQVGQSQWAHSGIKESASRLKKIFLFPVGVVQPVEQVAKSRCIVSIPRDSKRSQEKIEQNCCGWAVLGRSETGCSPGVPASLGAAAVLFPGSIT